MPDQGAAVWRDSVRVAKHRVETLATHMVRIGSQVAAHHGDNAIEVFDRGKLESQLAFPLAEVDAHPRIETVREPSGLAIQLRVVSPGTWLADMRGLFIPQRND